MKNIIINNSNGLVAIVKVDNLSGQGNCTICEVKVENGSYEKLTELKQLVPIGKSGNITSLNQSIADIDDELTVSVVDNSNGGDGFAGANDITTTTTTAAPTTTTTTTAAPTTTTTTTVGP